MPLAYGQKTGAAASLSRTSSLRRSLKLRKIGARQTGLAELKNSDAPVARPLFLSERGAP